LFQHSLHEPPEPSTWLLLAVNGRFAGD